jgi:hypothetical protein
MPETGGIFASNSAERFLATFLIPPSLQGVALIRVFLAFFLVVFGIFAAMGLMLLGLVARIFGQRPAAPTRPAGPNQNQRSPESEARPVAPSFARGEIIDIESKPVKE